MSTHQRRVDYDEIASTYEARYGSHTGEGQHTIPPALRELLCQGVRNRILAAVPDFGLTRLVRTTKCLESISRVEYEADLLRFPSIPQITAWLSGSGLSDVRNCVVERIIHDHYGAEVLKHSVLQKNGTSQLILLSDAAYADGLARLKSDLHDAEKQGRKLVFPEDISGTARRI